MALVDDEPSLCAARVTGDDRAVLEDLHRAGDAADLDGLTDEADGTLYCRPSKATSPSRPTGRLTAMSKGSVAVSGSGVSRRRSSAQASATVVPVVGQRVLPAPVPPGDAWIDKTHARACFRAFYWRIRRAKREIRGARSVRMKGPIVAFMVRKALIAAHPGANAQHIPAIVSIQRANLRRRNRHQST